MEYLASLSLSVFPRISSIRTVVWVNWIIGAAFHFHFYLTTSLLYSLRTFTLLTSDGWASLQRFSVTLCATNSAFLLMTEILGPTPVRPGTPSLNPFYIYNALCINVLPRIFKTVWNDPSMKFYTKTFETNLKKVVSLDIKNEGWFPLVAVCITGMCMYERSYIWNWCVQFTCRPMYMQVTGTLPVFYHKCERSVSTKRMIKIIYDHRKKSVIESLLVLAQDAVLLYHKEQPMSTESLRISENRVLKFLIRSHSFTNYSFVLVSGQTLAPPLCI